MVKFWVLLPEGWVGQFVRKEERVFCCLESSVIGAEGGVTIELQIHYSLWSSYWSLSANAVLFFTWRPTRLQSAALTTYPVGSCRACVTWWTARSTSMTYGRVSSVRVLSVLPCAGTPPEWHSWFVIAVVVWMRPLGRPRHRWEDNIKIDLQEVGCGGVDWLRIGTGGGHLWMRYLWVS
jgi:hypothetical protein